MISQNNLQYVQIANQQPKSYNFIKYWIMLISLRFNKKHTKKNSWQSVKIPRNTGMVVATTLSLNSHHEEQSSRLAIVIFSLSFYLTHWVLSWAQQSVCAERETFLLDAGARVLSGTNISNHSLDLNINLVVVEPNFSFHEIDKQNRK